MEAKDLMIGDLVRVNRDVCIKNDTIVRVCGIDATNRLVEKGLEGSATCVPVDDIDFYSGGIWVKYLSPIPLTPEILEKNGFRQDKKCPFVYETDDEDVIIDLYDPAPNARLSKKEDYDKMVGVRLSPAPPYGFSYWGQSLMIRANYVHELQHALRLCGIDKEIVVC